MTHTIKCVECSHEFVADFIFDEFDGELLEQKPAWCPNCGGIDFTARFKVRPNMPWVGWWGSNETKS